MFKDFRPEVVDHHAAQSNVPASVTDPVYDASVNVLGGLNLLKQSAAHGVRKFIYISSGGAMYGEPDHRQPARPRDRPGPAALPVRRQQAGPGSVAGRVPAHVRTRLHRVALREHLRPAPGHPRGGRRRGRVCHAHGRRSARHHRRQRPTDARLRVCRRLCDRQPGGARARLRRRLQHRDGQGNVAFARSSI